MRNGFLLLIMCVFSLQSLWAQERTVSGTVTDGTEPLPGVNIMVKGATQGTVTDFSGNYRLNVPENATLVFSYIGYQTREVPVGNRSVIDVQLETSAEQLAEVVVIGYGTTTVENATGAITSVSEKDFNQGNIVTPENLLNGRVAGVTINSGGAPGSGAAIRIRGGASLDASNDPLIVINGLPIDNNAVGGARSILSSINPNDIESFTVLKDASATAIYGSRASNGVIIIETKEATKDFQVTFDARTAASTLARKIDVFTADEFREIVAEHAPEMTDQLGDANTDWQEEIFRTGITTSFNLAVQGNVLDKVPTRVSIGRTDQEGIRLTSKYERTSASINLNPTFLDDHLRITLNANGVLEENRFAPGVEGGAITFDPTQPVYDSASDWGGYFQFFGRDNFNNLAPWNPVSVLELTNDNSEVKRFYGNIKFDYALHFFPDVSVNVNLGIDDQSGEGHVLVSPDLPVQQPDGSFVGSERIYSSNRSTELLDTYLDYNKDLGELDVEATLGYSYQRFEDDFYNSLEMRNDNEDTEPIFGEATDLVLIGFFGRTNLAYNDKYLLTLSYRRDGTSRFSEENRWGNFPAAAFAWKVRDEFFPNSNTLSTFKLRVGWGITGQQDVGVRDIYLPRYVTGRPSSQYQFGDQVIPVGYPTFRNENLKWEETTTWNIGLDYGILENRFWGSLEAFYKVSDDLLANAPISDGSNFSNAGLQNIGSFTSKGIEFAVNGDILRNERGLNWNVNFNATFLETEIDELAQDDTRTGGIGGGTGGTVQIRRVGFDPRAFYVYKQVYDETGRPIEGAYVDLDGNNIINDNDRYIYRNASPNATFGFLSNLNYRNFDLSFNMRASYGNYVYNNVNSSRAQLNIISLNPFPSNVPTDVLNTGFQNTEDVILSDYYIEDGSFIKMDNITLGYTFENVVTPGANLRLAAGVENVFIITEYSGIDPEIFGGIDNTIYPRPRTFYLAANIRF
ncbi:MAG: SusC/RagA family TonB-linked outer membrane protein [Candidatus Cyclobacteriaceae bacterium M2_1C_046]